MASCLGDPLLKLFSFKEIDGEAQRRKKDLRKVFIDLEKTYDSVPRNTIRERLKAKGISQTYIEAIRDMYDGALTNINSYLERNTIWNVEHERETLSKVIPERVGRF